VKIIAQIAQVGREDVYRLMPSLYERGLIRKHIGSPTRYEPVEPSEAMSQLISDKSNELSHLKSKALEFITNAHKNLKSTPESELFLMTTNLDDAIHTLVDAIKNARESWIFTSGYDRFINRMNMPKKHEQVKQMLKAVRRGVKIKAVLDQPKNRKKLALSSLDLPSSRALVTHENFEYRYTDAKHAGLFSVFDSKLMFIETQQGSTALLPQLWSNNQVLLGLGKTLFENAWQSGYYPE
jgi:sugar-specific transcriptional regulator TrmB